MAVLNHCKYLLRWAGVALLLPAMLSAEPRGLSEQELKAAALNQLVHFVHWPANAFPESDTPLMIGIYGPDPFGALLDDLVRGENVGGHPVKVVRCFTPESALACHALFVSASDVRTADRVVHFVAAHHVLTVTDGATVEEYGAIIAFTVQNHRIHIAVNLDAARKANLTLSSKLLRLAEITKNTP